MKACCLPIVLLTVCFLAQGHEAAEDGQASTARYRSIPDGAIKIPIPTVAQPDESSCGAAALMSVCRYFGVGPDSIDEYVDALGTNERTGTYYKDIVAYARRMGLDASSEFDMTAEQLQDLVGKRIPVICSIQAHASDPSVYDDPDSNDDGHYVVAVGFDRDNVYFMDPSIKDRRGFLSWRDFEKRWHENEATRDEPEVYRHHAVILRLTSDATPFLRYARRID
ncbi:MAG TPA: C39 family peptidase [Pirellulales bacterium]|nr:C39 family peptidase [Pirellulales bacterium]